MESFTFSMLCHFTILPFSFASQIAVLFLVWSWSRTVRDGHTASFQRVSTPPLGIAPVTVRCNETKRKETAQRKTLAAVPEPVRA